MATLTHADIMHERNRNGSITVTALMPGGYFHSETYYGFTVRAARKDFHNTINADLD